MAARPPPPPPKASFSLYDNLADPNDPAPSATIASAAVLYNQSGSAESKKPLDPALRFQPIRRPPVKQAKVKGTFVKPAPGSKPFGPGNPQHTTASTAPALSSGPAPVKSSLADWAATEEDEWRYGLGEKRQRGGRKKKRKQQNMPAETDWDEMYDPARPTNVDEYLRSDEKIDEVREWKALLYRHRRMRDESTISSDDDDEDARSGPASMPIHFDMELNSHHDLLLTSFNADRFAPPPSYASVPPPAQSPPSPPPPPQESGDDAYARRLALSSLHNQPPPPSSPPLQSNPAPSPPPPPSDSATISRAPVLYTRSTESPIREDVDGYSPPPALGVGHDDDDDDDDDKDQKGEPRQRSNRPGQVGFAHRLMSKYGWTKGSGLGADESGIVNPLRVQVEKRRKKADADGGGWAEPGGKGKIIGSKRKEDAGKFGTMSDVIILKNMLENMPDLQAEIADGLGQEIGEECGEKYGRVERLYIDQSSRQVFIKFTTQVSALRAVNELDGRIFNGNTIVPKFYDSELFDKGVYRSI